MTALLAPSAAPASPSDSFLDDPLFQLQIRVARRADELARPTLASREADVQCWHQAEREIFEVGIIPPPTAVPSAA